MVELSTRPCRGCIVANLATTKQLNQGGSRSTEPLIGSVDRAKFVASVRPAFAIHKTIRALVLAANAVGRSIETATRPRLRAIFNDCIGLDELNRRQACRGRRNCADRTCDWTKRLITTFVSLPVSRRFPPPIKRTSCTILLA